MGIRQPGASNPENDLRHVTDGLEAPVGFQLGKFLIRAELGRGGMGVVYLAEDRALNREVALKILPSDRVNEERRMRFLREARAAGRISHPNVIMIYDTGEAEGASYIAMEYVEGRTLRAVLKELAGAPLPLAEALRISRAIAEGLESAHAVGVLHRDLKPENVMLSHSGAVKILDFGLAKLAAPSESAGAARESGSTQRAMTESSDDALTTKGRVLGTPSYMSPEQVTGRPLDLRSDLFSLGVILYEMLTGARPFRGNTTMEVLIAIDRDEPEPASQRNPAIPASLDRLLARCMAKRPAQRMPVSEILHELDRLRAELADPNATRHEELSPPVARDLPHHQIPTIGSTEGMSGSQSPREPLRSSFTTDERALIAVIMIGSAANEARETVSPPPATSRIAEELRREVMRRGGQAEVTVNGSFAATFAGRLIASDQAAQAARTALALRRIALGQPIALAMGRGEGSVKQAPIELLARASQLLDAIGERRCRAARQCHRARRADGRPAQRALRRQER